MQNIQWNYFLGQKSLDSIQFNQWELEEEFTAVSVLISPIFGLSIQANVFISLPGGHCHCHLHSYLSLSWDLHYKICPNFCFPLRRKFSLLCLAIATVATGLGFLQPVVNAFILMLLGVRSNDVVFFFKSSQFFIIMHPYSYLGGLNLWSFLSSSYSK